MQKLADIIAKDPSILPTLIIAPFILGGMLALFLPLPWIIPALLR